MRGIVIGPGPQPVPDVELVLTAYRIPTVDESRALRGSSLDRSLEAYGAWSARTDADGRFTVPWPPSMKPQPVLRIEERSDPKRGAPPGWIPLFAEVAFPALSSENRFELGDVRLQPVPVVLAGRVVDAGGAPVNQAWLRIGNTEDPDDASAWRNLKIPGVSRASTDADGAFSIRSLECGTALRVQATGTKDRASEELVETINQELGELVRNCVAEAIEREIDSWKKGGT